VLSQVALALALMGERRVLVIDANLRDPVQHEKFRVRRTPGLADAVAGRPRVEECIVPTGLPGLDVLPAGNPAGDALAALISESCEQLFTSVRERYSYVVVDSPGMLAHPEAALLAPRTDGVIVVARSGQARRSDLTEVARVISGLGVKHLGVVLSRGARGARRPRLAPETAA
jgi:Mrp family chromosome partitioning ATPase